MPKRPLRERGSAAIEFAMIAPLLVGILSGSAWLAFQIHTKMVTQTAAQTGMHYVMRNPDTTPVTLRSVIDLGLDGLPAIVQTSERCDCQGVEHDCSAYCPVPQQRYLSATVTENSRVALFGRDFQFSAEFSVYTNDQ